MTRILVKFGVTKVYNPANLNFIGNLSAYISWKEVEPHQQKGNKKRTKKSKETRNS